MILLMMGEGCAYVVINLVLKKPNIYMKDHHAGWKVRPNLAVKRKNEDGELWLVKTNEAGYRMPVQWKEDKNKKVLILGDSFAFGEGVNVEYRFDQQLMNDFPDWSFVNLGIMGYGTDQALLSGQPYFPLMKDSDVVILFTYINDFNDILGCEASGRVKPCFLIENGQLVRRQYAVNFLYDLRDQSYLLALFFAIYEILTFELRWDKIDAAFLLYQQLLSTYVLNQHGKLIIVYHGFNRNVNIDLTKRIEVVCKVNRLSCINLDAGLINFHEIYMKQGHWNKEGHEIVGRILSDYLRMMKI